MTKEEHDSQKKIVEGLSRTAYRLLSFLSISVKLSRWTHKKSWAVGDQALGCSKTRLDTKGPVDFETPWRPSLPRHCLSCQTTMTSPIALVSLCPGHPWSPWSPLRRSVEPQESPAPLSASCSGPGAGSPQSRETRRPRPTKSQRGSRPGTCVRTSRGCESQRDERRLFSGPRVA